jgi:hypothetical protein
MPDSNQAFIRRLVILGIMAVVLLICIVVYVSRPNSYAVVYPSNQTYSPPLTNAQILQNWLPTSAYNYTISNFDSYLKTNGTLASSMTIKNSSVRISGNGTYTFTIVLQPQLQTYSVGVSVSNYSGSLSTAITIDGQLQTPQIKTSGVIFNGTTTLINQGLTTQQVDAMEQALQKFEPGVLLFNINTSSITQLPINPDDPNPTIQYSFAFSANGTTYNAILNCPSLTSTELLVYSAKTSKQVFDSGTIVSQ